ncbi:hypothetical protein MMPV_007154 [Pyropia vietnamensis]
MRRSRAPSMQRGGLVRRVAPPGSTAAGIATPAPVAAVVTTGPPGATPRPLPARTAAAGLQPASVAISIARRSLSGPRGGSLAAANGTEEPTVKGEARPIVAPVRKSATAEGLTGGDPEDAVYFKVMYTKRSKKKHKSYLDGFLVLKGDRFATLYGDAGAAVAKSSHGKLGGLKPGNTLEVGSWEVEVDVPIAADDFVSGRVFLAAPLPSAPSGTGTAARVGRAQPPALKRFKSPTIPVVRMSAAQAAATPTYDPSHPSTFLIAAGVRADPRNAESPYVLAPVVMDPYLGKSLRPHQREGIRFLYKCVTGDTGVPGGGHGAILADSMGLGKSLQALSLLWTVLKQRGPLVRKAIIVCPASLVSNWVKEVTKWLGPERLKPVAVQSGSGGGSGTSAFGTNMALGDFVHGNRPLLIISYDMLRVHVESINAGKGCGLLVCDEGHRLKASGGNKTIAALSALRCNRRVILTGTPVQNDLEEFFAMCSFVNPACLGSLQSFRSVFAAPILASRDASAGPEERALGRARALELSRVTRLFVLRRTAATLEEFLPPKCETTIFCRLAPSQAAMYATECGRGVRDLSRQRGFGAALSTIMTLRKLCAHPILVSTGDHEEDGEDAGDGHPGAHTNWKTVKVSEAESGKLNVALAILDAVYASSSGREKTVLVSNFTRNLDLFESLFIERDIPFLRLDGSTPAATRGSIVDHFNRRRVASKTNTDEDEGDDVAVLLLSAKAGGVGLNLIGANHLILFDPDWNPATDHQSMGRVWRDGQKLRVNIYRLISTGTIEEKILQRQLFKGELQSVMDAGDSDGGGRSSEDGGKMGGSEGGRHNFSVEELRELFNYTGDDTVCDTLTVLESGRGGSASILSGPLLSYRESGGDPPNALLKAVKEATGDTLSYLFFTESGRGTSHPHPVATERAVAAGRASCGGEDDAADLLVASGVADVDVSASATRSMEDGVVDGAVGDNIEADDLVLDVDAHPTRTRHRPRRIASTSSDDSDERYDGHRDQTGKDELTPVSLPPSGITSTTEAYEGDAGIGDAGIGDAGIGDAGIGDAGSDACPSAPSSSPARTSGRARRHHVAAVAPTIGDGSCGGSTDGSNAYFDWEAALAEDEAD